jgi:MerR family transcriptional regulator/heat shock protein HspR
MIVAINDIEPMYTIGIVAQRFKISVHTLRLYEAEGLIIPFKTETNRRLYSKSDINRIACIRKMIDEKGYNIKGIKGMLSLIPCWKLLPCSKEDCKNCGAFTNTDMPCWTVSDKAEKCQLLDCRTCHVYQSLSSCDNFKEFLKENWR